MSLLEIISDSFRGYDPFSLNDLPHLDWATRDIAQRAYALLEGWSAETVREIAEGIDAILAENMLGGGETTGERVSTFKMHYKKYDLDDPSAGGAKPHHYFAVLALCQLAHAAQMFSGDYDWTPPLMDWPSEPEEIVIRSLIGAMDAVSYAERLESIARYEVMLQLWEAIDMTRTVEAEMRAHELEQLQNRIEKLDADESKRRSLDAAKAARRRHRARDQVKEFTLMLYESREWTTKAEFWRRNEETIKAKAREVGFAYSEESFPATVKNQWLPKTRKA